MRIFFAGIIQLIFSLSVFSQQSISEIRLLPPGSVVTTTGVVSVNGDFGAVRYIQDSNAGIALYSTDLAGTGIGDSILVTGVVSIYRGELQLSPVLSYSVIGSGKKLTPLNLENILDFSFPAFESRKVIMSCAGINSCESSISSGWYILYDQYGNTARLWIADNHPVEGFPIIKRPVSIEGIWTKFEDQYQLVCQSIADASEGACHYIPPALVTFSQERPLLQWSPLPVGETKALIVSMESDTTIDLGIANGSVELSPEFLVPGKLYSAKLLQQDEFGNQFASMPEAFTTPAASTPIEILFNRQVDATYSDGSSPIATGASAIETDLVNRIDDVTSTLDVAMYNTGRASIVQAITRAVQRGVAVRYIADDETSNSALDGQLAFPLIYRSGSGIMHNKFIIADANDPDHAWLWAGSTNLSTNQLSSDPNHAYIIHDQALTLNYLREFDEMWGQPAIQVESHFGDFKTNNTAHFFRIGDLLVESWFSPSDEANCRIIQAMQSADHQLLIGLLLLTRDDLVDEIIAARDRGVEVRVILNDVESSSTAYSRLMQSGISIVTHDPSPIFHHKYAIIDEGFPESDPQVISGSHNWTWSADNINDENMLIFHDQSVTNIFRQEYEARWSELSPNAVATDQVGGCSIYPNPASEFVAITNPALDACSVEMINLQGQVVDAISIEGGHEGRLDINPSVADGMYAFKMRWPDRQITRRIIVIR